MRLKDIITKEKKQQNKQKLLNKFSSYNFNQKPAIANMSGIFFRLIQEFFLKNANFSNLKSCR